jgi:hypothetical protein
MMAGISRVSSKCLKHVGLGCILFAIVAGTINAQRNLVRRMQAHKIYKKSFPDLEGPQTNVIFGPFC